MEVLLTTICYIIKDDRVLLLHRRKPGYDVSDGKYLGLGGKVDPGESPRACIIREVEEESGLVIPKPIWHGTISFPCFDDRHEMMFVYSATEATGELIDSPEGDLVWIPMEEVYSLPMWEGDRHFLPWVFEGKFFEAEFFYDDQLRYQDHKVDFFTVKSHG